MHTRPFVAAVTATATAAAVQALVLASPAAHAQPRSSCAYTDVPAGAAALGLRRLVTCVQPTFAMISPGGEPGSYPLYSSLPYQGAVAASAVADASQPGTVSLLNPKCAGSTCSYSLATVPASHVLGPVRLLPGSVPWYVESCTRTTTEDPQNWPSFWLLPVEHDNDPHDLYGGVEHWMELDIDEGGLDATAKGATLNTVINWTGTHGADWKYSKVQNGNNFTGLAIKRTEPNCFGAAYDPLTPSLTWWVNDRRLTAVTGTTYIPQAYATLQHYYLIWTNQNVKLPASGYQEQIQSFRIYMDPLLTLSGLPPPSTASTSATVSYSQAATGAVSCRLDGGPIAPCPSPKTFAALAPGPHTVQYYLIDSVAGLNPYYADASYSWSVTAAPGAGAAAPVKR